MLYFGKISTLVSPTPLEGTSMEGKSVSLLDTPIVKKNLSDTLIVNLKDKNKRSGIAFLYLHACISNFTIS